MDTSDRIKQLITDYLSGHLDPAELDELKVWIASSPENAAYFSAMRELWFSAYHESESTQFDAVQGFRLFKERISKQRQLHQPRADRRSFQLWSLLKYAAILVLIFSVGIISYKKGEVSVKNIFADITIEAPAGSRTKLYLPDSTLVWLNAGSKIVYSQGYGVDNRKVKLNGEAYFEVVRNEQLPFYVTSPSLQIHVLGTVFNFRDYETDSKVTVSLLQGKVSMNNLLREEKEEILLPNQRMILDKAGGPMRIEETVATNAARWTRGYMFFDEEPLPLILHKIEKAFDIHITIANESLKDLRFYGEFNPEKQSIRDFLETLSFTNSIRYKFTDERHIILY